MPDSIRAYHKILTLEPHIAGLKRDVELTNFVKYLFLKYTILVES